MDTKELLQKVKKIEIKTKSLSKHIFSGEYHSAFKGRGMSFSEVREYAYGDDIRDIDWNVTARTGDTYIKVFEEERELTVMLLVDMSRSALFGSRDKLKSELVAELSAILAFSATTNNDKVGAILFTDKVEKYIPPKKGKQTILRIIREIINRDTTSEQTNIDEALRFFTNIQKKRSVAFLISDFMDTGFDTSLKLASKKHDMIGMQVYDRLEAELPKAGILRVTDAETGKSSYINTWSASVRRRHKEAFEARSKQTKEIFRKSRTDFVQISTEEDYVKSLLGVFKRRSGR